MIVTTFTIELDIGLSYLLQSALPLAEGLTKRLAKVRRYSRGSMNQTPTTRARATSEAMTTAASPFMAP